MLPGPCYWLLASGTPVGWHGGCLALGLVRGAMRHYCLGRCSALVVCVRRSRPVRGGSGRCQVLCLPCFPLPAPRFLPCVWRAVPSGCCLSSLAGTPFHAVCAFRGLGPVAPSGFLRVSFVCVCARALASSAPPPPPRVGVARAPRAVPVLDAGKAVPLGPCPSACPASVPCSVWLAWGGAARSRFPLPGFGLRASRRVGAGVGTRHQPHRARSCELALRAGLAAVGAAQGRPGGAPLAWVRGARGRALSHPRPLVLSGVRPGPTTHGMWVRGVRARGLVTNPTARALASWLCALWGRHEGARGGGASCLGVGRPGSGALPSPTTRLFGRAAGAHYPLAVGAAGAGMGTRHQPHSARSCELALRALGAA